MRVEIRNEVYQNKDIFADKIFPVVIWMNQNVSPVDIAPALTKSDIQGKQMQFARTLWKK